MLSCAISSCGVAGTPGEKGGSAEHRMRMSGPMRTEIMFIGGSSPKRMLASQPYAAKSTIAYSLIVSIFKSAYWRMKVISLGNNTLWTAGSIAVMNSVQVGLSRSSFSASMSP
jgi:hypothetical protein